MLASGFPVTASAFTRDELSKVTFPITFELARSTAIFPFLSHFSYSGAMENSADAFAPLTDGISVLAFTVNSWFACL
jgi:hypothetical protein